MGVQRQRGGATARATLLGREPVRADRPESASGDTLPSARSSGAVSLLSTATSASSRSLRSSGGSSPGNVTRRTLSPPVEAAAARSPARQRPRTAEALSAAHKRKQRPPWRGPLDPTTPTARRGWDSTGTSLPARSLSPDTDAESRRSLASVDHGGDAFALPSEPQHRHRGRSRERAPGAVRRRRHRGGWVGRGGSSFGTPNPRQRDKPGSAPSGQEPTGMRVVREHRSGAAMKGIAEGGEVLRPATSPAQVLRPRVRRRPRCVAARVVDDPVSVQLLGGSCDCAASGGLFLATYRSGPSAQKFVPVRADTSGSPVRPASSRSGRGSSRSSSRSPSPGDGTQALGGSVVPMFTWQGGVLGRGAGQKQIRVDTSAGRNWSALSFATRLSSAGRSVGNDSLTVSSTHATEHSCLGMLTPPPLTLLSAWRVPFPVRRHRATENSQGASADAQCSLQVSHVGN